MKNSFNNDDIKNGQDMINILNRGGFKITKAMWKLDASVGGWVLYIGTHLIEEVGMKNTLDLMDDLLRDRRDLRLYAIYMDIRRPSSDIFNRAFTGTSHEYVI